MVTGTQRAYYRHPPEATFQVLTFLMGIDLPDVRAHSFRDSASGTKYHVIVRLSEDKADFEKSTIDLRVTDSSACWEGAGVFCRASLLLRPCCPVIC